jgi:hypothetical protein
MTVKGWKKIYQANGPHKQAGVAILILNKVDFKLTLIQWDYYCLFLLFNGTGEKHRTHSAWKGRRRREKVEGGGRREK